MFGNVIVNSVLVERDRVDGKLSYLSSNSVYDPLFSVERKQINGNISAVILHRTVSSNGNNLYNAWKGNNRVAGTHFLVGEDGKIYQTANLNKYTIHLRSNSKKQMYSKYYKNILNSNTVGIEVIGDYNAITKKWDALTPAQITAVAELVLELTYRYDLEIGSVLPHEKVQRKTTGEGQVVLDAIIKQIIENW